MNKVSQGPLRATVGNIELETPLLLASGYISETPEFFLRAQPNGCAGIVTRSLKLNVPEDRQRVPAPRYVVPSPQMMLNCEWSNEHPWTRWRDQWAEQVHQSGGTLIVSLSGRDIDSCATMIQVFDQTGLVAGYEINVSCSHSGALHGNLNVDPAHLRALMDRIRPITHTPIWIKLSYSTQVIAMACQAEQLGADAIVCTNSIGPGLLLDTQTGEPLLGIKGGAGGMTGPAIFPIALRCVYEISKALKIPVVGVGGISSAETVVQMLMAGASAVQLYTAPALQGPKIFTRIKRDLYRYLSEHAQFQSIQDLVAVSHGFADEHQFQAPAPRVVDDLCTGCGLCEPACAFDAIHFTERENQPSLAVITDNCIGCNACVGACPPRFSAIYRTAR
jgi:dihydroorotate dehydrogenase (NAD+) catalytic subunit